MLVRPAVEAGERLGFLPGDLAQKVDPYLRPLYDALYDLMGFDKTGKLFERQTIEIAPLAYMRGRTLNHSFIILDEAQNTTPEQMKMFLTRIGFGTKAVITGDVTQIDLARGQKSGLIEADRILAGVRGIAFTRFTSADVVRHPLVQKIIDAYERDAAAEVGSDSTSGRDGARPARASARAAERRRKSSDSTFTAAARARLAVQRAVSGPGCRRARRCAAGRAPRSSATRASRCASSARARAARSTRIYRGKDYATNVLTFVYDDAVRRSQATSCSARRCVRREARAQGKTLARTARISSSTACCTCRATTTNATPTPRAMEARETRAPAPASRYADPYARVA